MKLLENLIMKSKLLLPVTLLLGCVGGGVQDYYKSGEYVTEQTPLKSSVHILGDSFWDYGKSDNGAPPVPGRILREITSHTGLIYVDHSQTNASMKHISETQLSQLKEAQPGQIRTILVNGGANDVKKICAGQQSIVVDGEQIPNFTIDCKLALDDTTKARKSLLNTLLLSEDLPSLQKIVWVSTISFPTTTIDSVVTQAFNQGIRDACEAVAQQKCLYVDVSTRWNPTEADGFVLNDKMHVDDTGAAVVGNAIWDAMVSAGVLNIN